MYLLSDTLIPVLIELIHVDLLFVPVSMQNYFWISDPTDLV